MSKNKEIKEKIKKLKIELKKIPLPSEFPKSEEEADNNEINRGKRWEIHYKIKKLEKELKIKPLYIKCDKCLYYEDNGYCIHPLLVENEYRIYIDGKMIGCKMGQPKEWD